MLFRSASQGKTVEEAVELYIEDEDVTLPDAIPIVTMFEVSQVKAERSRKVANCDCPKFQRDSNGYIKINYQAIRPKC